MSARPPLEVTDLVRLCSATLQKAPWFTHEHDRVLRAIEACRTDLLGGFVQTCDTCGHRAIAYCSCRNRHCPKCQAMARARWVEAHEADLLPVPYFHVVFTLPEQIAELALRNKRVVYGLLFAAAAETLHRIAADPKHLGARIGFLAILHTWGQTLTHHPHLHIVVPGGGLSPDGSRWVHSRPRFFLPVRVLSKLFRRLFLQRLTRSFVRGDLVFPGILSELADPQAFHTWLAPLARLPWVVYAKRPFGGPRQVLRYLGRYTHRVAFANSRLVALEEGHVTFTYKDYRHKNRTSTMTLDAGEFLRRFLLHVLPGGFQRIRQYGLLSARHRTRALAQCRRLLGVRPPPDPPIAHDRVASRCPVCREGRMHIVERFEAGRLPLFIFERFEVGRLPLMPLLPAMPTPPDTS